MYTIIINFVEIAKYDDFLDLYEEMCDICLKGNVSCRLIVVVSKIETDPLDKTTKASSIPKIESIEPLTRFGILLFSDSLFCSVIS